MKVEISDERGVIWMRDTTKETPEGIASRRHLVDGTQQRIIECLEDALAQATVEGSTLEPASLLEATQ